MQILNHISNLKNKKYLDNLTSKKDNISINIIFIIVFYYGDSTNKNLHLWI